MIKKLDTNSFVIYIKNQEIITSQEHGFTKIAKVDIMDANEEIILEISESRQIKSII